jgi:hypothetical protein
MSQNATNTRASTSLAAAAVVLTMAAITGCADAPNPAAPTSASNSAPASVASAADTEVAPELAAVRRATAPFHDVTVAIGAGYVNPMGGHCDASPAGTMGIHSAKPGLVQSQVLDPLQPEVLLYLPADDGLRLVAVEYVQPVLLRNPATGVVAPWVPTTPWPADYQVITPTPSLFGETFQGPMAGHVPGMPWHWDLHVWVWAHNPSGMFAQWNPALTCPGGASVATHDAHH